MTKRTCVRMFSLTALSLGCSLTACEEAEKPAPKAEKKAALSEVATTAALPLPKPAAEKEPPAPIECAEGKTVDFHDKVLEKEVRRKLAKPEGELKKSELRKIRSINLAKGSRVDYLDPCVFPHLTGVRDLFLGAGNLVDLEPLAALTKLTALRASVNQVSDVSVLSKLVNLDRLDLGRTQVKDLKPLSTLTNLTELQLDGTPVEDVTPLSTLTKLNRISLRNTQVTDISPLKPLKDLKQIDISGARVADPYALARPGLKVIEQ